MLYSREVIFTEDVEHIFGKRQWASRTDEILAAQKAAEKNGKQLPPPVPVDVEATEVKDNETPEKKDVPTGKDSENNDNTSTE